jgi:PAS domain-containing protein
MLHLFRKMWGRRINSYLLNLSDTWRSLFQVLPDEIVIVDEYGRIRYISEEVGILTVYTPDEFMGQTVEVLVPSRFLDGHIADRSQYSESPSVRPMDYSQGYSLPCKEELKSNWPSPCRPSQLTTAPRSTGVL